MFPVDLRGATPTDLLDVLRDVHGVPKAALRGFREHDEEDGEAAHALLPVDLLLRHNIDAKRERTDPNGG